VHGGTEVAHEGAWGYEHPSDAFESIAGYVAFYAGRMEACFVDDELEAMGLVPFVKTSGGKGVHVVVPIKPKRGWKEVHPITAAIAEKLAPTAPQTFTTTMGKTNRKRKIFIDFHRNARGATAAAPYTLRARTNLPASTPLAWSDLESIDSPEDLN